MNGLRTLPIRVAPLPGESLISWMEAYARSCHVDLREQFIAVGLRSYSQAVDHTLYLHDEEAERVAAVTGIPVARVHATTLRPYLGHVIESAEGRRSVNRAAQWSRGRGSRYCPACLKECDGRWLLRWRLSWAFACTRHQVLLCDTCPVCGRAQRAGSIPIRRDLPSHQCPNTTQQSPRVACGTDLSTAATVPLEAQSPVLDTQRWIDLMLDRIDNDDFAEIEPGAMFNDLRALAQWVLQYQKPGDFTDLAPGFEDIGVEESADWRFAPASAQVTAAAASRAARMLRDPGNAAAIETARTLLGRQRELTGDNFNPAAVRRRWSKCSLQTQQLIGRAMDGYMGTVDRLRYRSFAEMFRPTQDTAIIQRRARYVPQLLWPGWSVRLLPSAGVRATHFRAMMSTALLMPGFNLRQIAPLKALLHITWPADPSPVLSLIHDGEQDDILAALCRIVEHLDTQGCPIDYERRRNLVGSDLLPVEAWHEICRSTGARRGQGDKAWKRMRGFLYQRVTGSDLHHSGHKVDVSAAALVSRTGANPFRLTALLVQALDEYAVDYLQSKGIDEPLLWEPPARCADGLSLPGRDPQDIDISEVHRLVDAGAAPSRVAELLGTSSEHVRFAIEQHPPAGLDAPRRSRTGTRANPSKSTRLTEQFLREEHVHNRKPSHKIAQETGYTHAHIQERLRRFGLTQSKADRAHINEDWLREQYLVLGRTQADIAAEHGCCYQHVSRSLKRLGIPTRARQRNLEIPAGSPAILTPALRRLEGPDRLRLFEFTMRHDSIRAAAAALGVHESALGQRLRLLEREFGQPLFIRAFSGSIGRHQPTMFGREVLEAWRKVPRASKDLRRGWRPKMKHS